MNIIPSKDLIIKAVMNGIKTAKNNFEEWTGEKLFLSYAPDNFISMHVAQEIAKLDNKPEIFINASIADTLKCALPSRNDYKDFMKKKNINDKLFCITLDERFDHETNQDSIAKVIMSTKNGVRNVKDEYTNDIEVMCKVLDYENKNDSSLDYAIFAFYLDISNTARIKAKKRIKEIVSSFDDIVSSYKNLNSTFIGGDVNTIENIGEWSIGLYIIEPKCKSV
jgi:hypothetical protein